MAIETPVKNIKSQETESENVKNYPDEYFSHEHDFYELDKHGNIIYKDKELYISKLILSDGRQGLTIGQFIRSYKIHKLTGHNDPSEVVFYRQDLETGELTPFSNTLQLTWLQDYIRKTMGIRQNSAFVDDEFDPDTSWDTMTSDLSVSQLYNTIKNDQSDLGVHIYDSEINLNSVTSQFVVLAKSRPVTWKLANRTFKFKAGNIFKERKRIIKNSPSENSFVSRKEFVNKIKYKPYKEIIDRQTFDSIISNCTNYYDLPKDPKKLERYLKKFKDHPDLEKVLNFSERKEFLNLAKKYLLSRKNLQFSPNYSDFLKIIKIESAIIVNAKSNYSVKSTKPYFKDRAVTMKALSEWFGHHLVIVQTCQTKLVEMECTTPTDKIKIRDLVISTCNLIPILKEHKKKPYIFLMDKKKFLLKNKVFNITTLVNFYKSLKKTTFLDIIEYLPRSSKKQTEFENLKHDFARLTANPVENNEDFIQKNRFFDILQSELRITKFLSEIKNWNKGTFPSIRIKDLEQWKNLNFDKSDRKNIEPAIENRFLNKSPKINDESKDFFNRFKKEQVLKNSDFLKALAGRIVVVSKSSKSPFSTDPKIVQEKFQKWFGPQKIEPKPIKEQIEKHKKYLEIVSKLQEKYKFDFSNSDNITIAQQTLEDKEDKTEDIEYLLKKSADPKKTFFYLYANRCHATNPIVNEKDKWLTKLKIISKLQEEYDFDFSNKKKISDSEKFLIQDSADTEEIKDLLKNPSNSEKTSFSIYADMYQNWLEHQKLEPNQIRVEIRNSKNYLKMISKLKEDPEFNFSTMEEISNIESILNEKSDKTEEIKSLLKKPPISKKTYFSIFAKKLLLQNFLGRLDKKNKTADILNYKELILKQSLAKENNDKVHIIRKPENKVIWYYYVYELNIKEEENTSILLSGRMKHNPKFPYHQSLEILFNNLEESDGAKLYTYDNSNWMFPFGYLFEIFDNYFILNEKYLGCYGNSNPEDIFYSTDTIKDLSEISSQNTSQLLITEKTEKKVEFKRLKNDLTDNWSEFKGESGKAKEDVVDYLEKIENININLNSKDYKRLKKHKKKINGDRSKLITKLNTLKENTIKKANENKITINSSKEKGDIKDSLDQNNKIKEEILNLISNTKKRIKKIDTSLKISIFLYRYKILIDEAKISDDITFRKSIKEIKKFMDDKKFLKIPRTASGITKDKKLHSFLKRLREILFDFDLSLILYGMLGAGKKFLGFKGLFTFPIIQLEPSGNVTILNTWEKMYPQIQSGLPAINTTGVDLGLRTPVAIGDVTLPLQPVNESNFEIHHSIEKSEDELKKPPAEDEKNRDFIISQSNITSKKNINKAFYLQRIAQKTQKEKAHLKGKPLLQSSIRKSALSNKQNNINNCAAHELASSIINYAKSKTDVEKIAFEKTFKNLYGPEIKNIEFNTPFYPEFDNSLLKINTEKLLLSTKSGDPYAAQKSQWLYGQIRKYLKESGQIQGIQIFNDTPPAYTSKLSHTSYMEGKKGYLVKIEEIGDLKKIIIKESPSVPKHMGSWKVNGKDLDDYQFHPLVRNSILRRFNAEKWEGFKFIPLGSGNIFWLNPSETDEKKKLIIDRDSNASINIATYNPFLYNANVINLQIDRIKKGESVSKSQKIIKNKLVTLITNFYKAFRYFDNRDSFGYPYSYLCLFQIPESLQEYVAKAVYKGLIYHVKKSRRSIKESKTLPTWRNHIENLVLNTKDDEKKKEKRKDFIDLVSAGIINPGIIDKFLPKITRILNSLKENLPLDTYGKITVNSLITIDILNQMTKKKNQEEEPEKINKQEEDKLIKKDSQLQSV